MTVRDVLHIVVENLNEAELIELIEQLQIISSAQQMANLENTPESDDELIINQSGGGFVN